MEGLNDAIQETKFKKCDDEATKFKSLLKGITVSRLTLPDDANIYGNVHGGTILKLIEEAGAIIATRYCNTASEEHIIVDSGIVDAYTLCTGIQVSDRSRTILPNVVVCAVVDRAGPCQPQICKHEHLAPSTNKNKNDRAARIFLLLPSGMEQSPKCPQNLRPIASNREPCVATMVRIEHMDFMMPMMIGEVAQLTAEIVFTSPHSLLVEISVQAENIITGTKRKTNRARLWYVPIGKTESALGVPPMCYDSAEVEESGRKAYEEQKADREKNALSIKPVTLFTNGSDLEERETVAYSQTFLSFLVGQNDVTFSRHCRGGVLLKLMDECAGIVAAKHCHTNVVTACLNATNFYTMIKIGSVVTVFGQVTFTSNRSMEIEVIVAFDVPFEKGSQRQRAVDAFFTYVSIDKDGKALPVPPLKVRSDEEKSRFDAGSTRYEMRRRKIAAKK